MVRHRYRLLATALVLSVPLIGCTEGTGPASGSPTQVAALDNEFDPSKLTVAVGETVKWTNQGELSHTVEIRPESGSSKRHSQEIEPGQSTSYTFDETGTYEVWCQFHGQPGQGMAMTVTVQEKGHAQG